MTYILYLILAVISLRPLPADQHPVHSIRMDPDNARGGNVSDFFQSVEFIPLETNQESLFGDIYKLQVTDDYLIIKDNETGSILIFNSTGKFQARIKQRHRDFTLDREREEILVLDSNSVSYYDFNGKLLRKVEIRKNISALFMFGDGSFVLNKHRPLSHAKSPSIDYDLWYSSNLNDTIRTLFSYNPQFGIQDYNTPSYLLNDQGDGTCFYTFPYRYNIYELDASGIRAEYRFVFPENYSLPRGFDQDSLFYNKRKEYIFNPKNVEDYYRFTALTPFFRHEAYVFFNTNHRYFTYRNDLLYDLQTQTTYSLNRLTGDSISSHLPILHSGSQQAMKGLYNGSLYTRIPASSLLKLINNVQKQGRDIGDQLSSFLATADNKTNPVIIRSRFK